MHHVNTAQINHPISQTSSKITMGNSKELIKQSNQISEILTLMQPVTKSNTTKYRKRNQGTFVEDDELYTSQQTPS